MINTSENGETVERLNEFDRILLHNAAQAKQQADATHRFVTEHVAAVYRLTEGCGLDLVTGVISRPGSRPNSTSTEEPKRSLRPLPLAQSPG